MTYQITATDFTEESCRVKVDVLHPDYCPYCHRHIKPAHKMSFLSGAGLQSEYLQRVYRCTNRDCGSTFLAIYAGVEQQGGGQRYYFYKTVRPGSPLPPEIPENIEKLSPNFSKIYTQALNAEYYGLSEICGGGFRKSLEFLVKDFLIAKAESLGTTEESIKKTPLGQCIENYIDDPKTKAVAKMATWLGNDEIHYFRKWEDKELQDLKNLLHLTINSIDNDLLAEVYLGDMGEGEEDQKN